ncbi:hypothetical protein HYFRA_00006452 [Hymenoscyphus fraxineus]|uniref:Uncharacterized protein n=1 Tax=Hymenoscyphus fraxineus TaxID=746836 RepID=A0A9N9KPE2_9HELO|nr:hypothetical protein HYFRA_00006452 [Hymenoscyphus fraxineus]
MARQQTKASAPPSKPSQSNTGRRNGGRNGNVNKLKRPKSTKDKTVDTLNDKGKVVKSQTSESKPSPSHQTAKLAANIPQIEQPNSEEQNKLAALRATELVAQSEHALKSSPLFLAQYKVAYNHNYGFSVDGGNFNLEIFQLPKDCIPAVYDFVTSIYPGHAFELKKSMNAALKVAGVLFMTGNQTTYAGTFQEKTTKLPWTLANLIANSKTDVLVKYYKYLEKWLGLWGTSIKLKKRLDVALLSAETSKAGTQDPPKPSHDAAPITNVAPASKGDFNPPINPIFPLYALVDTADKLSEFLGVLGSLPRNGEPNLFCHAVTERSSGALRITLLAIFVETLQQTFVVDIKKLGPAAFHNHGRSESRMSLRRVLEDMSTPKVFTSIKNITPTLHRDYQVLMQAVIDEEVLEKIAAGPSTTSGNRKVDHNFDHCRWIYLAQSRFERGGDDTIPTETVTELITLGSAALKASEMVPRFVAASLELDMQEKMKVLIESVKKGGLGIKGKK